MLTGTVGIKTKASASRLRMTRHLKDGNRKLSIKQQPVVEKRLAIMVTVTLGSKQQPASH